MKDVKTTAWNGWCREHGELAALGTVVERFVLSKTRYSPLLAGTAPALTAASHVLQLETLLKLGGRIPKDLRR